MTNINFIALLSSISSLVLAIVAIWLALHHKRESDNLNKETRSLLYDVRSDAKVISSIAMPELKAYGEAIRKHVFQQFKDTDDSSKKEIEKFFSYISEQLNSIKSEENLKKDIVNRISNLEKELGEKKEIIKKSKSLERNRIYINLEVIGSGIVSAEINQFSNIIDLLDFLYFEFLSVYLKENEYGENWILVNSKTKTPIEIHEGDIKRFLHSPELRSLGGIELKVVFI